MPGLSEEQAHSQTSVRGVWVLKVENQGPKGRVLRHKGPKIEAQMAKSGGEVLGTGNGFWCILSLKEPNKFDIFDAFEKHKNCFILNKKLSCRRETTWHFVSLYGVCKSLLVFHWNCLYLVPFLRCSVLKNRVTLKVETGVEVVQGHWKWRRLIDHIRLSIGTIL